MDRIIIAQSSPFALNKHLLVIDKTLVVPSDCVVAAVTVAFGSSLAKLDLYYIVAQPFRP